MQKKYLIVAISITITIAIVIWAFIASSQPLPGVEELQDGRSHAASEGTPLTYKFNPPTSGDHYASWITKGFYEEPRADGNIVHSLEHGYIVLWYDCSAKLDVSHQSSVIRWITNVYAQTHPNTSVGMTSGSEGSPSAKLSDMPKSFSDGSCSDLKNKIKEVMKENGDHKLIALPRPKMGNPLTLTAWGRAEKLNSIDQNKIKAFIGAFRDHGPEQTDEP